MKTLLLLLAFPFYTHAQGFVTHAKFVRDIVTNSATPPAGEIVWLKGVPPRNTPSWFGLDDETNIAISPEFDGYIKIGTNTIRAADVLNYIHGSNESYYSYGEKTRMELQGGTNLVIGLGYQSTMQFGDVKMSIQDMLDSYKEGQHKAYWRGVADAFIVSNNILGKSTNITAGLKSDSPLYLYSKTNSIFNK